MLRPFFCPLFPLPRMGEGCLALSRMRCHGHGKRLLPENDRPGAFPSASAKDMLSFDVAQDERFGWLAALVSPATLPRLHRHRQSHQGPHNLSTNLGNTFLNNAHNKTWRTVRELLSARGLRYLC